MNKCGINGFCGILVLRCDILNFGQDQSSCFGWMTDLSTQKNVSNFYCISVDFLGPLPDTVAKSSKISEKTFLLLLK